MGPERARVVDMLKNEKNFEFAMNRKEDAREGISQLGFLNQYETGNSSGMYNPAYRTQAEANFLGITVDDYSRFSPRLRPKYGYLRPSPASGVTQADPAPAYGTDTFVFKRSAVKDNVTFWPYDTLSAAAGSPTPTNWDQAFIPFRDRMLLAPSLLLNGTQLTRGNGYPPGFTPHYTEAMYVELQFWRPLGLEDVERFEFAGSPPAGDFLAALRAHGVKIFRKGETAEWHDDAAAGAAAGAAAPAVH
jgi:hypothetical protein